MTSIKTGEEFRVIWHSRIGQRDLDQSNMRGTLVNIGLLTSLAQWAEPIRCTEYIGGSSNR